MSLQGKTLFITGASRGIGLAIGLRAARDGANVVIAAKTAEAHKHLPGTIYSAAAEIEAAGGQALPLTVDVRDEASVLAAVEAAVARFGGIDICVNNASAIQLTGTLATDMKRYDLMHQLNARGTFLVSKACIPHLKQAANPHILALSPPLDLSPHWFGPHVAYTMAKYSMSLAMLGMAEEFREDGIACNGSTHGCRFRLGCNSSNGGGAVGLARACGSSPFCGCAGGCRCNGLVASALWPGRAEAQGRTAAVPFTAAAACTPAAGLAVRGRVLLVPSDDGCSHATTHCICMLCSGLAVIQLLVTHGGRCCSPPPRRQPLRLRRMPRLFA